MSNALNLTAEQHEIVSSLWTARKMLYSGDPKGNLHLSGVLRCKAPTKTVKDVIFYIVSEDYLVVDIGTTKVIYDRGTVFRYNSEAEQMHILQGGMDFYKAIKSNNVLCRPVTDMVLSIESYTGKFVAL